jgi:hypothetical protein
VLASVILASTTASYADEEKNYRYGLRGNNLVFKTVEEALTGGSFLLSVKGGQPGRISVKLVDIVANASGSKSSTPLNSSPFTPSELVTFTNRYPAYQPSEEFQYFEISMKFKDGIELDRPVLGGLSISLIPDKESKDDLALASSIVATFAYIPGSGINLEEYAPALSLTTPTIDRENPDFFPLNLLPNLPFLPNHGDLRLSYGLENTGKIFLETSTEVKVEQLNLFGQLEGEAFTQSNEAFLVPGQKTQSTVEIAPPDLAKSQLGIGIYRFTTTASGEMGDQIETSTSNQQTLVIFPWKQSFIAFILLILFRKRIYRSFNWVIGYGRALRDFRYKRPPKSIPDQEPVFESVSNQASFSSSPAATQTPLTPAPSAPVVVETSALAAETSLEPKKRYDPSPEVERQAEREAEPLANLSTELPLAVKPEANPEPSTKKQWTLPKLTLPSMPKFQLPTWKIPRLPKLEFPKVDLSAAAKSVLEAMPNPKPRPTATQTPLAPEAPKQEPPQTSPEPEAQNKKPMESRPAAPATPRPASPTVRPTGSSKTTSTPGTSSPRPEPKPLYPYWYQPPKKDGSG